MTILMILGGYSMCYIMIRACVTSYAMVTLQAWRGIECAFSCFCWNTSDSCPLPLCSLRWSADHSTSQASTPMTWCRSL